VGNDAAAMVNDALRSWADPESAQIDRVGPMDQWVASQSNDYARRLRIPTIAAGDQPTQSLRPYVLPCKRRRPSMLWRGLLGWRGIASKQGRRVADHRSAAFSESISQGRAIPLRSQRSAVAETFAIRARSDGICM